MYKSGRWLEPACECLATFRIVMPFGWYSLSELRTPELKLVHTLRDLRERKGLFTLLIDADT